MTTYVVTRKSDGVEVYRYNHTAPVEWVGFEFATHDHVEFVEPAPPAPVVQPVRLTKLAFINRFTDAEWIAFDLTALDDPTGAPAARQQKSGMRLFMKKVELAQFIDLNRADTRTGVQTLEAVGLLAAGRAAVILDTPPTDEEVWNG